MNQNQNVLVVDGGGRGHALAWRLAQSPRVKKVYIAPGNAGTAKVGSNVNIKVTDIGALLQFVEQAGINFTVAPQDDSLAAGIVDAFQNRNFRIFGPTSAATQIEADKAFAKLVMHSAGVNTAPFEIFDNYERALAYVRKHGAPIVVKASGLALGKGAYVCKTMTEAEDALNNIMVRCVHGAAGREVVIEEFLEGPEISAHAFCDGKTFSVFPTAQDHKPIFDGGHGPNTGGMGTISPVPWFDDYKMLGVESICRKTLDKLDFLARPFTGCLYPGLKETPDGNLAVLEFNARPGDPETQSYMRLLETDLFDILEACVDGTLADCRIEWNPGFAVCIVLASGGYPGGYKKGIPIFGIEEAEKIPGVEVFHAGTTMFEGQLVTSGGRVLGVTALRDNLAEALQTAYKAVDCIHFEGMQFRRDIGAESLARFRAQVALARSKM
jgi:phosphoribosylamine--glycine ligase